MKAKLVKHASGYILFDEKGIQIGATPNVLSNDTFSKLSLKNCQAIERGYDLDELAMEICDCEANECDIRDEFKKGFQKALEILGDRKFSEEDVLEISWELFRDNPNIKKFSDFKKCFEEHIQSLQQTEWDVEVEMEYIGRIKMNKFHEMKPKLDADGCLILKRKA